ncbi:TerC family protein [Uliginosibacterium aquaticum]|uniref:TerC family protein n=1 Tax=Uliginosibacterium aquaticum TaxID=2731212 RepID=A0ABX2ID72_9RHOO|nr:TerC family protein [Uliginosibacterium aquaticum]NSL54511.1 TerC family protein [Uliginosibacterium aquaticum]
MEFFLHAEFWLAVGQIIMIDILLGGDNAVVIALACRQLAPAQRTKGIIWGTVGAIVLRVILIFFALTLLKISFLKLIGAALLIWIGVKLLLPEGDDEHSNIQASDRLWSAVKTVIVADFVMSLDNVIAIAGAAEGAGGDHKMPLVIFGLLVSIPIIVWGSQIVIKLMERYPVVILLGAMLLGWIAGHMAVTDPVLQPWTADATGEPISVIKYAASVGGALLVWGLGKMLGARKPEVGKTDV